MEYDMIYQYVYILMSKSYIYYFWFFDMESHYMIPGDLKLSLPLVYRVLELQICTTMPSPFTTSLR
jgi:hypothetical protein